ncbi:MAG: hypothetical protein LBN95_11485 [Prevotellaceae bacterium]|jgi:hypothetical protein|nr:hypothetical protein [Prevotellaceae bacterium]
MKKIFTLLMASFVLLAGAEAQIKKIIPPPPPPSETLSVSPTSIHFESSGGSETLIVKTNISGGFSISAESSWCSVSISGKYLYLDCKQNTSANSRNDYFYVNAGKKQVKVELYQAGKKQIRSDADRIRITDVKLGNVDKKGNILNDYGYTLYDTSSYIRPKISYENIARETKDITLYMKIIKPDGTLSNGSATDNYSYSTSLSLSEYTTRGENTFLGWGNAEKSSWKITGTYTWEIWCSDKLLYTKTFEIRTSQKSSSSSSSSSSRSTNLYSKRTEWRRLINNVLYYASDAGSTYKYKGEMYGSDWDGLGVVKYDGGDNYWGKFSDSKRDGYGIYFVGADDSHINNCPDCMFFVGTYRDGQRNGKGTCYDKNGKLLYFGEFRDGVPVDTYPNYFSGSTYKFEYIEYESSKYLGETKDGEQHGYGIYLFPNSGAAYYSGFLNGEIDGTGLYVRDEDAEFVTLEYDMGTLVE